MTKEPTFDLQEAHKHFSAHCFNRTWNFIDKSTRTSAEDDAMLQSCLTSLWHWSQRTDTKPENLSVGYWQASRVFALLGKADDARRYAQSGLERSQGLEPFYVGYAYEALARSAMIAGDRTKMKEFLDRARSLCDAVADPESKKMLSADLNSIT